MSDLLNSASLVMIPSGYKEDVVYSQIPTDGSGDLSFTRASNGTRVNSAGLVEVCPWNLLQSSETFNLSPWATNAGATITSTTETAPNGTLTADLLSATTNTSSGIYQVVTGNVVGQIYTASLYVKNNSGATNVKYQEENSAAGILFNAVTGAITSTFGTVISSSVESVGNGWYRIQFAYSSTSTTNVFIIYSTLGSANTFILWGAQLNIGSTAKPYFPTTDLLNVPRLTYQNGGGGCPSLLLEKQSTNYARNWNLTAATWSTNAILRTANAGISPDGTNNAYLIYPSPSGTDRFIYDDQGSAGYSANTNYTTTVYAKAAGLNWAYIRFEDKSNITSYVYFNLATGVVGSTTGSVTIISKTIESVGNGWYRLRVTANMGTGSAGNNNVLFGVADGDGSTYATASGTNGVLFYGPQSEQSDYPTSPIPTSGSSATRVADACFKTGISSLIGQTEGTIFYDLPPTIFNNSLGTFVLLELDGNIGAGYAHLYKPTGANEVIFQVSNAGILQCSLVFALNNNTRYKVAAVYKNNRFELYVNGVLRASDYSGTLPSITINKIQVAGDSFNANSQLSTNELVLFKTALTQSECEQLTA